MRVVVGGARMRMCEGANGWAGVNGGLVRRLSSATGDEVWLLMSAWERAGVTEEGHDDC